MHAANGVTLNNASHYLFSFLFFVCVYLVYDFNTNNNIRPLTLTLVHSSIVPTV